MRNRFFFATLTFTLFYCLDFTSFAQNNDRFAFAITDINKNGSGWNALRRLDLQTGEYSEVLLNGSDPRQLAYDAVSKKPYTSPVDSRFGSLQGAFATGVAAMAYDKKNNRLYFTPMFVDQLRYIDLRTMKLYYVTDQQFSRQGNHTDEGKIVTRMTIAPDGFGYAITNDGETFVRFSTGKKLKIEHLGSLVDAPNNIMSIKSRCSSWGGDMIADDEGKLYIFSARNVLYKVDIESRIATLQPPITGLSQNFTINGAVVNENNQVLVSSAVDGNGWFVLDPQTWKASPFTAPQGVYKSSDLANSNYLSSRARNNTPATVSRRPESPLEGLVAIYPNPVNSDHFTIQFGRVPAGNYNIEMTDIMGRSIMKKMVNVSAESQVETISLKQITAKGVYMVKITNPNSIAVLNQKLVVQ